MTARRPLSVETAAHLVGLADMVKAERARRGLSLRAAGTAGCGDAPMTEPRQSIQPTYDSRETGPRYYLSTFARGRSLDWRKPIDDPFVSAEITIGWPGLLRALLHRRLVVRVQVDADRDLIEDVLELDGNYLGPNCTRRAEYNAQIHDALS